MQNFKSLLAIIFAEIALVFTMLVDGMFFKYELLDVIYSNDAMRELLLSTLVIAGPFVSLLIVVPYPNEVFTNAIAIVSFAMAAIVVWRVILLVKSRAELNLITKWLVTWLVIGFVNVFLIIGASI